MPRLSAGGKLGHIHIATRFAYKGSFSLYSLQRLEPGLAVLPAEEQVHHLAIAVYLNHMFTFIGYCIQYSLYLVNVCVVIKG